MLHPGTPYFQNLSCMFTAKTDKFLLTIIPCMWLTTSKQEREGEFQEPAIVCLAAPKISLTKVDKGLGKPGRSVQQHPQLGPYSGHSLTHHGKEHTCPYSSNCGAIPPYVQYYAFI